MLFNIIKQSVVYLTKSLNFYFFILFFYSFCIDVRVNFFICSFIKTNIIFATFGFFIVYFLITFFLLFLLFFNFKVTFNVVAKDWLSFTYRSLYVLNVSALSLLSYALESFLFYVVYLYRLYSNFFLVNIVFEFFNLFFSRNIWYPIYKRHSYFGYFRSIRQKWLDTKSESINRLKY